MSTHSEKTIYTIYQAYGELREIIDGGSESFTHEDAVQYLKDKLAQPEQSCPECVFGVCHCKPSAQPAVTESHKQEPVEKIISNLEPLLSAKNQSWAQAEKMLRDLLYTTPPQPQSEARGLSQSKPLTDEEYKIGQEVRVTRLTYGGAVYNSKREIINANQPPHKTVCIGRIVEIKQECENGAVIVKCEGDDKFLPRFHFYPQDNGPAQIVEISAQSKELKHEPEIWLDLEKLTAGGMAYATNFQSTTKQSRVYTTPPTQQSCSQRTAAVGEDTQRAWVGLTQDQINNLSEMSETVAAVIATDLILKQKNGFVEEKNT